MINIGVSAKDNNIVYKSIEGVNNITNEGQLPLFWLIKNNLFIAD